MSNLDPRAQLLEGQTVAFLQTLDVQGGPPIYTLTSADARNLLLGAQTSAQVVKEPADLEDRSISGGPTGTISLRVVRPYDSAGRTLPAILYIHGGGWVLGDKETHDRLVRELANGAQATVVFVDYARSPEAKYPIAIEQAYTTLVWMAEYSDQLNIDPARIAIVGDSVGGNMAAAVTLLAQERQGPKLAYQVLFYPVTDAGMNTASYREFGAGGYWLTAAAMRWFWDAYVPAGQRQAPTVSPLQAPIAQLRGLPPALIIVDENDVLRDEGEAYARKLQQAGVPVTAVRALGTIHDFVMLNALAETPATRGAIAQTTALLRRAFAGQMEPDLMSVETATHSAAAAA
jgi:acetyl esterase